MTPPRSILVDDTAALAPGGAVAAILIAPDGRYLLQLRDNKPGIFYPDHWGFFGGALESEDQNPGEGLRRELGEELGIDVPTAALTEFTDFTFDFAFAGRGVLHRKIFVGRLTDAQVNNLTLGEGADVRLFDAHAALAEIRMTPYDAFALWLYHARDRLRSSHA